jgi:drug/metabolite transporter (DMT)-like permease
MVIVLRLFLANGFALMILSAFFYALTDVLVKLISSSMAVIEIAFFRFLIGGVILLSLILPRGISLKGNQTSILVIRGLSGTLAFLCILKSLSMIPLANAMVLFYSFPVFATFFSFLLFRERVGKVEIILIAVGVMGITILMGPRSYLYEWGDVFALLGGCFAGFTIVLIQKLRETNGALIIYFYFCVVGGMVSFPFFLRELRMPTVEQFLLLVGLGVIFSAAQLLMTQGFKFCKASEGSVILMSELVFAGIAGVVVFKDALSPALLVGTTLILGSGVGLNLLNRRLRYAEVSSKR